MIRKLSLLVLATSLIVTACGRQVTPDRAGVGPGGLTSGYMQLKFRTVGQLDFSTYLYVIAFNTTGTGSSPHALNAANTNFPDFSYEFVVGGSGGTANVALYQIIKQLPGGGQTVVQARPLQIGNLVNLNTNSNGQGNEFSLTFSRTLFFGLFTPTPGPTPTLSPTPSPTPTGATPSPVPTGSPTAVPTVAPPFSNIWYWNFFVAQPAPGGSFDLTTPTIMAFSQANLGASDTTFVGGPLDINTNFDTAPVNATLSPTVAPAAQISVAAFLNAP